MMNDDIDSDDDKVMMLFYSLIQEFSMTV